VLVSLKNSSTATAARIRTSAARASPAMALLCENDQDALFYCSGHGQPPAQHAGKRRGMDIDCGSQMVERPSPVTEDFHSQVGRRYA
jgi:hypothetical protein